MNIAKMTPCDVFGLESLNIKNRVDHIPWLSELCSP